MRKEIEVKARAENIEVIVEKLEKLGCTVSLPAMQHDTTFVGPEYGPYDEFQPGKNVLRIRESNGKFLFTLKQPNLNEFDAIEYETEISDPEAFTGALVLMGYKKVVEIHKKRRKATYKDYEICLDEVEGLGSFIEAEKITDETVDTIVVQEELLDFLLQLGVERNDQVFHGYDTLIYLRNKKI